MQQCAETSCLDSAMAGKMDQRMACGLINSITRLNHLVACQTTKNIVVKNFRVIIDILKLLKPIIDEAFDTEMSSDEQLILSYEELDVAVNLARELLERNTMRIGKISSVLQTESMASKVKNLALNLCQVLSKQLKSPLHLAKIEYCLQELQSLQQDLTSELIEDALKDQKINGMHNLEVILKLMEKLSLNSSQELLTESIAIEKERMRIESTKSSEEMQHINQVVAIVPHVRHCLAKLQLYQFINGIPVPTHFRCPLSLRMMTDPVIVASGQTYERSFIQKWLDSGLTICPMTRQTLTHRNLTPNFTVKAMISNWCLERKIQPLDFMKSCGNSNSLLGCISMEDFNHQNGFHTSVLRLSDSLTPAESANINKQLLSKASTRLSLPVHDHQSMADGSFAPSNLLLDKPVYCDGYSESISSAISTIGVSSRLDEAAYLLSEVPYSSTSALNKDLDSPTLSNLTEVSYSSNRHHSNNSMDSVSLTLGSEDFSPSLLVQRLVDGLNSFDPHTQSESALELRLLSKNNEENRFLIAKCGAIVPLISLLKSNDKKVQENAVTTLLNLSISNGNKNSIIEAGVVEPLILVLDSGSTEAQENSAATLFSLSALEECRVQIGRSGAIKALVNLLVNGRLGGKKDAAAALFSLSILHENKARIVQAGAVKHLVELMDPSAGMVEKSVALLANLSTIPEGRIAIAQEGCIPLLVEILETGSDRGKENAASALFQLCINNLKFCNLVLQEGAVPPLIALSQFGSTRAKEKALQILGHFRSLREATLRKGKP
ncbi:hypothetical protein HPP92_008779 [Vanilla planifolia]|uniref:RING-type E3 ubiquitin transferase n=1 Tax=Vanilla planifolia TaxID=51239 RepID=A0A835V430_VANPL|nr:hypothetical protein HPP92_008779 [Vanilla planifolia]